MIIRLGYACISKTIDITCSKTISYTNYLKIKDNQERFEKLDIIIKENLKNLELLIDYNIKNNIHFFRLSSALIPLATIKDVNFDYINPYLEIYKKIGLKIKENNMRVDFHPDQFTVLNSTKKEVVENTFEILKYHFSILKALDIKPTLVLHIGSSVLGKDNSIKRFINNFNKLNDEIKKSIVLENDDKVYDVLDVLKLCKKIDVPFVLDYHHYKCNGSNLNINNYYKEIFDTWKCDTPKIHFSSPKNKTKKEIRSHHNYINSDDFISFIESVKSFNINLDIMIEAKAKDEALFRLVRELKFKTDYKFIDETSFEI